MTVEHSSRLRGRTGLPQTEVVRDFSFCWDAFDFVFASATMSTRTDPLIDLPVELTVFRDAYGVVYALALALAYVSLRVQSC